MSMVWLNTGVSVSVSDISLLATKLQHMNITQICERNHRFT